MVGEGRHSRACGRAKGRGVALTLMRAAKGAQLVDKLDMPVPETVR